MTTRLAACVTVPHFLLHIARQQEAIAFTQPLAIASDATDRATIIDLCPHAAIAGIHVGMSAFVARRQCRAIKVVTVAPEAVEQAVASIEGVLAQFTDIMTRHALGCWVLELLALGRHYAHAEATARELQHAVTRATSWPCTVGLGPQRVVARIAAQVAGERAPSGHLVVLPGTETSFLDPLPVQILPGVGAQSSAILERLSITTIGQLATLPEGMLVQLVGPRGRILYRHAQGLDSQDERPQHLTLTSIWRWGRAPTADRRQILARVYRLTERVGRNLRAQSLAAGQITVRVRWVDGKQRQAAHRFVTRCDLDRELAHGSRAALQQLLQERRLSVSEVRVSISDLGPRQADLWSTDDRVRHRQSALDQIKQRYGTSAILHAWLLAP